MDPLVPKQEPVDGLLGQQQIPLPPAIMPLAPVDQLGACQGTPAGGLEQRDEGMQRVKHEEEEQKISMEAQTPSLDPNSTHPPEPLVQPRTTTPEMSPGPSSLPPETSSTSVVPLTMAAVQALRDTTGIFDDPEEDSLSEASTSIAEGADPKRRTVLFPKDEEKDFASSSAFFSSCRKRLRHVYGLSTQIYQEKPTTATARCSRRSTEEKCKFTVRAALVEGRWVVRREKCIWAHSHDPPVGWESSDGERSETSEEERVVVKKPRLNKGELLTPAQPRPRTSTGVDPLSWTAETKSRDMLDLVKNREAIFAKQRQIRSSPSFANRSALSQAELDSHVSTLGASASVFSNHFHRYRKFCDAIDVPAYPISTALIALTIFARCSGQNANYSTWRYNLARLKNLTDEIWEPDATYRELRIWPGAESALVEFMDERKGVMAKSDPVATTSAHAAQQAAEEDEPEAVSDDEAPESNKDDLSVHGSDLDLDSEGEGEAESSVESSVDDEEIEVLDLRYETSEGGRSSRGGGTSASSSRPTVSFSTSTVYPTMRAMYLALVVAMIPAYGLSVSLMSNSSMICNRQHPHYAHRPGGTCPYTIYATQRDDGWVVDLERSRMKHNHGPDPRIVKDPAWRPVVRNAAARAALGMSPLAGSSSNMTKSKAAKGKGKEKESKPPKAKKERTQEQIERDRASMAHARQAKVEKRERQKEREMSGTVSFSLSFSPVHIDLDLAASQNPPPEKKPRLSSSSATPGPSSFSAFAAPHPAFEPHPPYPYSYPAAGPPSYPPPPPQAYPFRPSPAPPAIIPHVPRPPPPPSSLSLTHLSAFLHSLHPSLAPLAASFLATGLDSVDALASLALLEPHTLDGLVDVVRAKSEAGGGARMSVIQGKLFVKKLREAFAAGPR
ncbi:hypothetical protein JCM8097_003808 [Rhodosporidiobolus ruineniae]